MAARVIRFHRNYVSPLLKIFQWFEEGQPDLRATPDTSKCLQLQGPSWVDGFPPDSHMDPPPLHWVSAPGSLYYRGPPGTPSPHPPFPCSASFFPLHCLTFLRTFSLVCICPSARAEALRGQALHRFCPLCLLNVENCACQSSAF